MKWYEQLNDETPIVSCRLRLARNLRKYEFLSRLTPEEAQNMIKEVVNNIFEKTDNFEFNDLSKMATLQKLNLFEHHKISHELLRTKRPSALLSSKDDLIHVMLNEEDHIRIQSIAAGKNLKEAYKLADCTDDLIEESIEYAFHENYGYLTTCPSNTGTGMRASFMLHLPILDQMKGRMEQLTRSLASIGMTVRGLHGENSSYEGSIFQVSNQITMGETEEELIEKLETTVEKIVVVETEELEKKINKNKTLFEDIIYRAYGTLKYSRRIDIKEARKLLSIVRLGVVSKHLKEEIKTPIYNIMMNIDMGSLRMNYLDFDEESLDVLRAIYIRENL